MLSQDSNPEQAQRQLDIKIDVGQDVIRTVTINEKSGTLYDLHSDLELTQPFNLPNYLKTNSRWSSQIDATSITFYVTFLSSTDYSKLVIIDRDLMAACLVIYRLLGDENFFALLLEQLLQRWTLLSLVLYNSEDYQLPEEVKYDVFLRCPEMLLPKKYITDKIFMENWYKSNTENTITLNDFEWFESHFKERSSSISDWDAVTVTTTNRSCTYQQKDKPSFDDIIFYLSTDKVSSEQFTDAGVNYERVKDSSHKEYKEYKGKFEGLYVEVTRDEHDHERRWVKTFISGLQEGLSTVYDNNIKGGMFRQEYYEENVVVDDRTYFGDGKLDTWFHMLPDDSTTLRGYHSNGEEDYVIEEDQAGNTHAIKYLADSAYVEADRNAALFYDSNGHLVRKITFPFSHKLPVSVTMQEVEYNQNGDETSRTILPSDTAFDITLPRDAYPFLFRRSRF